MVSIHVYVSIAIRKIYIYCTVGGQKTLLCNITITHTQSTKVCSNRINHVNMAQHDQIRLMSHTLFLI